MVIVAVSMAALVLLATGVVMASLALFTSSAIQDPDKSSVLSDWVDTTDGFTEVMEEAIVHPTATPCLGAVVGNQVYLAEPVEFYTLAGPDSQ